MSGQMSQPRVSIEQDVVFTPIGGRELACDVYSPPNPEGSAPGLLLLHGGAWRAGDKQQMRQYGIQLALAGYVCVSSSYRLVGDTPWPAQMHDVWAALRFIHREADRLGIDRDKVAVIGASAGAHLALLAGGHPLHPSLLDEGDPDETAVRAIVAVFPPTVVSPRDNREKGAVPGAALLEGQDDVDSAAIASPLSYVHAAFPPTFLLHGTADKVVPPLASLRMYQALVAAGVPAELHMYAEQPHGFTVQKDFHRLTVRETDLFLRRYLGLRPQVDLPNMPPEMAARLGL